MSANNLFTLRNSLIVFLTATLLLLLGTCIKMMHIPYANLVITIALVLEAISVVLVLTALLKKKA
ncbi:hypothetical protein D0T51_10540 [Parabacteroides sp. 52]|uniref:hypothetical protein n=1 Tax=unclassified Parabacteroides TaxID=2649774 RepID=UPI0013D1A91F|nr:MULTISPECIES: hypothetical protein [unclassified Parabacteroides]MDH6535540.1 ABC-type Co2+ transport system permease subunit [Parabacteroides sp. PM5-20]NDV56162.1 hypothetical protein [Parabacteroides sp. 52]